MKIKRLWKKLVTGPTKRDLKQIIGEYRVLTSKLNTENTDLQARNRNLQSQLTMLAAPRGSNRALVGWESPGTASPQFVLYGLDRGAGRGVRLYASKDVAGTSFTGAADGIGGNSGMTLRATMGNMLTIDKASHREAIEHLFTIWRNWSALPPAQGIEAPKED